MALLGATVRPLAYGTADSTERHHGEEHFLPVSGSERALDQHGVTAARTLADTSHHRIGLCHTAFAAL
jgi:hypothetical protein